MKSPRMSTVMSMVVTLVAMASDNLAAIMGPKGMPTLIWIGGSSRGPEQCGEGLVREDQTGLQCNEIGRGNRTRNWPGV